MEAESILVVDDDANLLELIKMRLEASGYDVTTAVNEDVAKEAMTVRPFDLSLIDLQLVRQDGISLMEELHLIYPDMPIIILTAHGSIESAVEAMRKGAYTYLPKPFDPQELILQIERAIENRRLSSEVKRLKSLVREKYDFANIVTRNEKMKIVLEQVSRAAKVESNVYIFGESGTGKELIAKAIHVASKRRDNPFVVINCAALPESLLENELFGHEKGAFTGAVKYSKGLFSVADTGTLFLDEIGDIPLYIQAKLLRVIQEKQFYPLGSDRPKTVDVRIVVATNRDLESDVKKGRFRQDLFYRIHVIPIGLPPLRERKDDIPLLIDHFLRKFSKVLGGGTRGITPLAIQRLMLHNWPGNVRELENTIEYGVVMGGDDVITEDFILRTKGAHQSFMPLKEAREAFDKDYLVDLMRLTGGNVSRAAGMAGKYRADFYKLLKKYGLKPENFKKRKPAE